MALRIIQTILAAMSHKGRYIEVKIEQDIYASIRVFVSLFLDELKLVGFY